MPQFILSHGDANAENAFRDLPEFVQGYIEAMFFTDTGENGLEHADTSELAPEALASIRKTCEAFQAETAALLALAYERNYDAAQAGRDFWFTRQVHGAGFWDR